MRLCSKALIAALTLGVSVPSEAREVVDRIAAVIEDDVITLRELEEKAAPYFEQAKSVDGDVKDEKRRAILLEVLEIELKERIIERELGENRERLGVTEADVDHAIDEVIKMNNLTRDQLQAALYGQGMTWSEYRKKLRAQIERARLIQFQVQGKVEVKPEEVKRRCLARAGSGVGNSLKVCAAHILMRPPEQSTPDQLADFKAKVSKLQAELAQGADFGAYALKYSDDKGAPDGNLGCFGRGQMVEAFEEAAFALPVGGVSPVVQTEFGFHIIKVKERKESSEGCTTQEQLRPFQNEVYQEELDQQMNVWLDELREKAFVDVRL